MVYLKNVCIIKALLAALSFLFDNNPHRIWLNKFAVRDSRQTPFSNAFDNLFSDTTEYSERLERLSRRYQTLTFQHTRSFVTFRPNRQFYGLAWKTIILLLTQYSDTVVGFTRSSPTYRRICVSLLSVPAPIKITNLIRLCETFVGNRLLNDFRNSYTNFART